MATARAPWASACAWVCACMRVHVHVGTHAHGHLKWPQAAGLHANPRTGNPGAGWVPAPQAGQSQLQLVRGHAHISISLFNRAHACVNSRVLHAPRPLCGEVAAAAHTEQRYHGRPPCSQQDKANREYRYRTPRHTRQPD